MDILIMNKKFLTQTDRLESLKKRGNAITESFKNEFDKIKRVDESTVYEELDNLPIDGNVNEEEVDEAKKTPPNDIDMGNKDRSVFNIGTPNDNTTDDTSDLNKYREKER